MKNYLLNRIKEPSSWAGLSMLAAALGVPQDFLPVIVQIGAAVAAIAAIAMPEARK